MKSPILPLIFCSEMVKKYPEAPRQADFFRARRGESKTFDWPEWCFLPFTGCFVLVTGGKVGPTGPTLEQAADIAMIAPALAWRPTQDIVRFDRDVYDALVKTPPADNLPDIIFRQLPAWCLYVEIFHHTFHGFFVSLEYENGPGREELRLLFLPHDGSTPMPVILHLGTGSIRDGLSGAFEEARKNLRANSHLGTLYDRVAIDEAEALAKGETEAQELISAALSLTLYLCSAEPDWSPQEDGATAPSHAQPKKVKSGWRLFPPDKPRIWNVGMDTGVKIRAARVSSAAERKGPRPHIRRAHWHTYWTGRKVWKEGETPEPQTPRAKWLPPIPVALSDEEPQD